MAEKPSGQCEYCGHIRYTNDLFNGECVPCVLWAEDQINALTRQLSAANERAGRLEAKLRSLCERLDEWWYEADPKGDVKKGGRHPWTVAARKALEVPDAL